MFAYRVHQRRGTADKHRFRRGHGRGQVVRPESAAQITRTGTGVAVQHANPWQCGQFGAVARLDGRTRVMNEGDVPFVGPSARSTISVRSIAITGVMPLPPRRTRCAADGDVAA